MMSKGLLWEIEHGNVVIGKAGPVTEKDLKDMLDKLEAEEAPPFWENVEAPVGMEFYKEQQKIYDSFHHDGNFHIKKGMEHFWNPIDPKVPPITSHRMTFLDMSKPKPD